MDERISILNVNDYFCLSFNLWHGHMNILQQIDIKRMLKNMITLTLLLETILTWQPISRKEIFQHRIDDKRALKWDSNEVELWVYDPLGSLNSFNRFYSGNFIVEMWFCNWTKLRNYANCSIVALHIEGSKWISRYFSQARSWWGNCACRNIAATFLFLDFTSLIIISTDLTRFFLFPVSSSCDLNETEHFFIK